MTTDVKSNNAMDIKADTKDQKSKVFADSHSPIDNDDPPPSFPESQAQADADRDTHAQAANSAYPIQAHHTPVPSRTLKIKYTNWAGSRVSVWDASTNTSKDSSQSTPQPELCSAHIRFTKPHIIFSLPEDTTTTTSADKPSKKEKAAAAAEREFATISYRTLSCNIDTTTHGTDIPLVPESKWKMNYGWDAPATAAGGKLSSNKLVWRCRKSASELLLTDSESGRMIARYTYRSFNYCKESKLEVFDDEAAKAGKGGLLDEVLVTGVAIAHYILFINLATLGAASAAAA